MLKLREPDQMVKGEITFGQSCTEFDSTIVFDRMSATYGYELSCALWCVATNHA
jgi:hypothetical protein